MKKAMFLDRDGVINDNKRHVNKPEDLIIYNKAKQGMERAYRAGYELFIVTNQGGIELGHLKKKDLEDIHQKLQEELKPYCEIRAIRYCPDFHKKSGCRKPEPGMLLELAEQYQIDLKNSWMIGDMDTDIVAGIRAGCRTGKIGRNNPDAHVNGSNLLEVVEKILEVDASRMQDGNMDAINVMKDEHKYIKRVLRVFRKACLNLLEGREIDFQLFYDGIDFVRNFADKYHHSKEEDILFAKMLQEFEGTGQQSAVQGMFTEHDLGRLFMFNLEIALQKCKNGDNEAKLDVIGNTIAYTDLLTRHIHKEDNALYNYGVKHLKPEVLKEVNELSLKIDSNANNIQKRKKYIEMVNQMEIKVEVRS